MTPEAAQFLEKARECLRDSRVCHTLVPRVAGREAYLAAYHAAAALLIERTGSTARTHRGLRGQFARIAKDEPGIDRSLTEFLAPAYELKTLADYATPLLQD
jgi:uncharacterized protein (UPF0332 family)